MKRRSFLKGTALAGAGLLFAGRKMWATSTDSQIDILLEEPIGRIAPEIYG